VPKAGSSPAAFRRLVVRGGVLAAAVVLALALGSALTYVRDQLSATASATLRPAPATTAVPSSLVVSRQSVLAYVRGLTLIVPRAQCFEAKLVSSEDVSANLVAPAPAGTLFWLVAVAGDVNCAYCVSSLPQPLHSALFWFDAYTGNVLAAGTGDGELARRLRRTARPVTLFWITDLGWEGPERDRRHGGVPGHRIAPAPAPRR
jgi:hypothetical protein